MKWENLTYFGKGIASGFLFWLVILVLVGVRGVYLNLNLSRMNLQEFYFFQGSLGIFGMIIVGMFLVACFGALGWFYGRIAGEELY